MPKLTKKVPSYRRHKATGQAVVTLSGRDHYLGRFDSKESRQKYDSLIAEYLAAGRLDVVEQPGSLADVLIDDLILAFWKEKQNYYFKDGKPTSEHSAYKSVIRILNEQRSSTLAKDFGPIALKQIRQHWIQQGLFRNTVNRNQRRLVRVFKWGVENEMVAAETWQALKAVEGLKKGRTEAPEALPILPVSQATIEATLPHLSPVVIAMIRVQIFTGARPGEVCKMRPCDINRSGDVWAYQPRSHKTEHHGRSRTIQIGKSAQNVILPYLLRAAQSHCFSAAESREWFREQADLNRKTQRSCGNARGRKNDVRRGPKTHQPRTHFDTQTYSQAIARACRKAWPVPEEIQSDPVKTKEWEDAHRWAPNQLRHNWATQVRAKFGLEAAQVGLGHASADVTQIYAERDNQLAIQVAREIG